MHRVSDVQFWCGYNNNFIDLADWTSSCIENLTSKNIIVFAKFHPNVYNPTPKGEINYPVDHRYCNSLINKYGFSRLNRKNTFEKSNYLPNLSNISKFRYSQTYFRAKENTLIMKITFAPYPITAQFAWNQLLLE